MMPENEVEIYRKIAVSRLRAIICLLITIGFVSLIVLCRLFLQCEENDLKTIQGCLVLCLMPFFLFYIVYIVRLSVLLDTKVGCLIAFFANFLIPLVFIVFSLYVLLLSEKVLRNAGYTIGFFRTDWEQYSVPLPEFQAKEVIWEAKNNDSE
jgi:hypothetical protein